MAGKNAKITVKKGCVDARGDNWSVLLGGSWFWLILQSLLHLAAWKSRRRRMGHADRNLRRHL